MDSASRYEAAAASMESAARQCQVATNEARRVAASIDGSVNQFQQHVVQMENVLTEIINEGQNIETVRSEIESNFVLPICPSCRGRMENDGRKAPLWSCHNISCPTNKE